MLVELFVVLAGIAILFVIIGSQKAKVLMLIGGILLMVLGAFILGEGIDVWSGFTEITNTTINVTDYFNGSSWQINSTEDIMGNATRTSTYTKVYDSSTEMMGFAMIFGGLASVIVFVFGFYDEREEEDED